MKNPFGLFNIPPSAARRTLIIVSSQKPQAKCSKQYAAQQKEALDSWLKLKAAVILLNDKCEVNVPEGVLLQQPKEAHPSIYELIGAGLDYAKNKQDVVIAIVNSDIILTENFIKVLQLGDKLSNAWAATSQRYHYKKTIALADITDKGLDVFVATPRIWQDVYSAMPTMNAHKMKIGRNLWDTWLSGYFKTHVMGTKYIDFTHWKCVFHKEHPQAESVNNSPADIGDLVYAGYGMPITRCL
jgi:hypothetical protein